jgi:hypothetical protein
MEKRLRWKKKLTKQKSILEPSWCAYWPSAAIGDLSLGLLDDLGASTVTTNFAVEMPIKVMQIRGRRQLLGEVGIVKITVIRAKSTIVRAKFTVAL